MRGEERGAWDRGERLKGDQGEDNRGRGEHDEEERETDHSQKVYVLLLPGEKNNVCLFLKKLKQL